MTIPDYQAEMLPLLRFAADGEEHSLREAIDKLADHFDLSYDERKALLDDEPCRKNPQSIARIDRTIGNTGICRAFWRSVLRPVSTAPISTARLSTAWK